MIGPDTPLAELERIYRETPLGPPPSGVFRGRVLHWLSPTGPWMRANLALQWVAFGLLPWGIRFDTAKWFWFCPCFASGRFDATPGPSRWRDTETYRMDYSKACLPSCVRDWLYDEVKPLPDGTCLGIGGVNRDVGTGDCFFYLLTPRS